MADDVVSVADAGFFDADRDRGVIGISYTIFVERFHADTPHVEPLVVVAGDPNTACAGQVVPGHG